MEFKINFIIAGAQRSGTTALFRMLDFHPQICFYKQKEAHFFDRNEFFEKEVSDYTMYHNLFNTSKPDQIIGEGTPDYLYHSEAAKRIFDYNPNIKLIFLLRNPVDRAYSQYIQLRESGKDIRTFEQAVIDEMKGKSPVFGYLARGFYAKQIQRYFELFTKKQMYIRPHNYFRANKLELLREVSEFLNINPDFYRNDPVKVIATSVYEPMNEYTRHTLIDFFTPSIIELEELLQWDLSEWK